MQHRREKGTSGVRRVRDDRKGSKWETQKGSSFLPESGNDVCWEAELCSSVFCVAHPHLPISLALPATCSTALCHPFPPISCLHLISSFSLNFLLHSLIPISSCTVCLPALTLGSPAWMCHYNLPFTPLCFQPRQATPPSGHTLSLAVGPGPAQQEQALQSRPPTHGSITAAARTPHPSPSQPTPGHSQKEMIELRLYLYKADNSFGSINLLF